MKIVVLAVGKLRDRNVAALCDDYVARARRHLTVDVVEVEDDAALQRKWPAQGETIALDVGGESWTTERFARHLGDRMLHGGRAITFAIGGADGLPPALVARATDAAFAVGADAAPPHGASRPARADLPRPDHHPG